MIAILALTPLRSEKLFEPGSVTFVLFKNHAKSLALELFFFPPNSEPQQPTN
jgi:hypothetical protein